MSDTAPADRKDTIAVTVGEHALGERIHRAILAWRPSCPCSRITGIAITVHPATYAALLRDGQLGIGLDGKDTWQGKPVDVTQDDTSDPLAIGVTVRTACTGYHR